jgi:hypothetical protein
MVDVYFERASDVDRSDVKRWCAELEDAGIHSVRIGHFAVLVHGQRDQFDTVTGTAVRHGNLVSELNAALGDLRRARHRWRGQSGHPAGDPSPPES